MAFGGTNTEAIFHNVPPPEPLSTYKNLILFSHFTAQQTTIQLPCFDKRLYCN